MAKPDMVCKAMEANVRKWVKVDVLAMTSRVAGAKTTTAEPIPERIANKLITVMDLGRCGARS